MLCYLLPVALSAFSLQDLPVTLGVVITSVVQNTRRLDRHYSVVVVVVADLTVADKYDGDSNGLRWLAKLNSFK